MESNEHTELISNIEIDHREQAESSGGGGAVRGGGIEQKRKKIVKELMVMENSVVTAGSRGGRRYGEINGNRINTIKNNNKLKNIG